MANRVKENERAFRSGMDRMTVSGAGPTSWQGNIGNEAPGSDRLSVPRGLEGALLAAIVESSDDAIASKDLDGIVTSWNSATERLFGYPAGEIIGQHIAILAAPGREDEMPMILGRIQRGECVDHYDTLRRR